ncbi:MAG: ABC transporter permease [bacterium]
MKTIYILWLRQLKRYSRSKVLVFSSLAQPLLFLIALGFGFGPIYAQAGEGNYIQFLVPGIIATSILFTSIFTGIEIIWDKQFGFLKETLVAPVSRFHIMLGRTLGGATVATIQGTIVLFLSMTIGFRPTSMFMVIPALIFMGLTAVLFSAFGTAIACNMNDMEAFPLIMNFLVMPLVFLSGALFPTESLPTVLRVVTKMNPLSYGIDGIRATLTGLPLSSLLTDIFVLSLIAATFIAIGAYCFSKIEA